MQNWEIQGNSAKSTNNLMSSFGLWMKKIWSCLLSIKLYSPHPVFSDLPTVLVPVMALKAHQITIKVKVSHIIHATYTRHTAHMVNYSQVKNCLDMIPIIWSTFELTEFTWYIMQLSLPHHCFPKSTVYQFDIKISLNQT